MKWVHALAESAPFRAVGMFAALVLAGAVLFRVGLARLSLWAGRSRWRWDDVLVEAVKGPGWVWVGIAAAYVAVRVADLPPVAVSTTDKILIPIFIVTLVVAGVRIVTGLIREYASKIPNFPKTSLLTYVANGFVIGVGALMILNHLGISITPMLTALGVGGLAVALALQDTLTNFFAGFYLTLARKLRPGDFVRVDTGDEGYVEDIGWRETTIRTLPGNIVVVPNGKLSQAVVTNYALPQPDLAVLVQVGVAYGSDLDKVERVTCEAGREIMRGVEGGVATFDPFIRFHTFGDFSVNFTVILRGKDFVSQHVIKHEFIKRLHKRYRQEGIEIPFPVRTVLMSPRGAD
ncbi:MAG: mechanosensitive ion channel family protein [Nitrospirae bacterium]|nr:mechanosensitive ion channel family protein [Nitrospirota bacterium]